MVGKKETMGLLSRYISILLLVVLSVSTAQSQSTHELLRRGDESYLAGEYTTAEEAYRKAIDKEKNPNAKYNLGNSLYEQERFDEALEQYQSAINSASDNKTKSKAYHNLGNALFNNQKMEESLRAYKEALRYNPDDLETKHNLSYARNMMKQMQKEQQQQQQQENQEQQEGEESEEQQNQEQQEGQQQEGEESKEQKEQEQNKEEQEGEQEVDNESKPQEGDGEGEEKQGLDKEDARKLLEIAENEEKKVQEKMRKVGNSKKPKKDW